jgi:hypothetical protein
MKSVQVERFFYALTILKPYKSFFYLCGLKIQNYIQFKTKWITILRK